MLSTATPPTPEGEVWWTWLDPAGWLLYRLIVPGSAPDTAPRSLQLAAYDVGIGLEVGRLDLPTVETGQMGIALAPDGRRLALGHASAEAITLVDVERLAIERTLRPTRSAAQPPEEAREEEAWRAVFAADGRHLYIIRDMSPRSPARGPALALVDLYSGRVVAEGLDGERIVQVLPAPDARSVYVLGPAGRQWGISWPHRLRRLDAFTLAPLAEREINGRHHVLVWPGGRAAQ